MINQGQPIRLADSDEHDLFSCLPAGGMVIEVIFKGHMTENVLLYEMLSITAAFQAMVMRLYHIITTEKNAI